MIYTSADLTPPIPTLIVLIIQLPPPFAGNWSAQSPPPRHSLPYATYLTRSTASRFDIRHTVRFDIAIDGKAFNPNFRLAQFPLPTRPVRLTAALVPLKEDPQLAEIAGTCSTECICSG